MIRTLIPKKANLDRIAGAIVRSRKQCEAGDWCRLIGKSLFTLTSYQKRWEWAHIVSRRYLKTRWLLNNAFCLHGACHYYFTERPLEWEQFVIEKIGEKKYTELKKMALDDSSKVDYGKTYYELTKERKRLKL